MKIIAPPRIPPYVAQADDDGLRRINFRLHILGLTTVTILVTSWLITLGTIPAILGLVVSKHILVAILAMGLGVDTTESTHSPKRA